MLTSEESTYDIPNNIEKITIHCCSEKNILNSLLKNLEILNSITLEKCELDETIFEIISKQQNGTDRKISQLSILNCKSSNSLAFEIPDINMPYLKKFSTTHLFKKMQ